MKILKIRPIPRWEFWHIFGIWEWHFRVTVQLDSGKIETKIVFISMQDDDLAIRKIKDAFTPPKEPKLNFSHLEGKVI
jgi:hypothetical protein